MRKHAVNSRNFHCFVHEIVRGDLCRAICGTIRPCRVPLVHQWPLRPRSCSGACALAASLALAAAAPASPAAAPHRRRPASVPRPPRRRSHRPHRPRRASAAALRRADERRRSHPDAGRDRGLVPHARHSAADRGRAERPLDPVRESPDRQSSRGARVRRRARKRGPARRGSAGRRRRQSGERLRANTRGAAAASSTLRPSRYRTRWSRCAPSSPPRRKTPSRRCKPRSPSCRASSTSSTRRKA